MAEAENNRNQGLETAQRETPVDVARGTRWLEILKVLAIPLVTLILGAVFNASINTRQNVENRVRLYTEMMARREQADSDLRKDMFKSILDTFMRKDPKLERDDQLDQEVLNLELLAYNFHESLDLAPLFKHVRGRIPDEDKIQYQEMRDRLEKVAHEVILRQLTLLSDRGTVETGQTVLPRPERVTRRAQNLESYLYFDAHLVQDAKTKPGEGVSRLCLSMLNTSDEKAHYRQFKLEPLEYDPVWREVRVRLYVSTVLDKTTCENDANLDLVDKKEVDTTFWVGSFDFPMIDNTHLTESERCAVAVTELTPDTLGLALAYFPGSRASLKDKPYYDDVLHDLVLSKHLKQNEQGYTEQ